MSLLPKYVKILEIFVKNKEVNIIGLLTIEESLLLKEK